MKRYAINYLKSAGFDYESDDGEYYLVSDVEELYAEIEALKAEIQEVRSQEVEINKLLKLQREACAKAWRDNVSSGEMHDFIAGAILLARVKEV